LREPGEARPRPNRDFTNTPILDLNSLHYLIWAKYILIKIKIKIYLKIGNSEEERKIMDNIIM